jgi:Na+-transporting methylmalonyl-CoA/oxaloacetate decarboxylase gamma subunit
MRIIRKFVLAGLLLGLNAMAFAQDHQHHDGCTGNHDSATEPHVCVNDAKAMKPQANMAPQTMAFQNDIYAAINTVDNTIDIITFKDGSLQRTQRHLVDQLVGRHDLAFVFVPKSVAVYGHQIVYVAASRDSSLLRVLTPCGKVLNEVKFPGYVDAFSYCACGQFTATGMNAAGYTLLVSKNLNGDMTKIALDENSFINYRKPKKSEEIAAADPVGLGLTVASVAVVFLVLIFLAIIFTQYGKMLMNIQKKRAVKAAAATTPAATTQAASSVDVSGEVYAAIATAVHLYHDELHDEENTIITIQKVERSWTPWNAKYYNMNQYFNKRR